MIEDENAVIFGDKRIKCTYKPIESEKTEIPAKEDDCMHINRRKGICIECGLCIDEMAFQEDYFQPVSFTKTAGKYTVKNQLEINDYAIKKVIVPLQLECHTSAVKDLLLKTKFKLKVKKEDKVIVALYHILKTTGFPITYTDLLKYTSMSKSRLLKVHRDVFGFVERCPEYLHGIFERMKKLLEKNKLSSNGSFEYFRQLAEKNKSSDPECLCLAYLFEINSIKTGVIKDFYPDLFFKVQNVRRKIKKDFKRMT